MHTTLKHRTIFLQSNKTKEQHWSILLVFILIRSSSIFTSNFFSELSLLCFVYFRWCWAKANKREVQRNKNKIVYKIYFSRSDKSHKSSDYSFLLNWCQNVLCACIVCTKQEREGIEHDFILQRKLRKISSELTQANLSTKYICIALTFGCWMH